MKQVWLNGGKMISPHITHQYLKARLGMPDYYGYNLDALWDVLSTLHQPIEIGLFNLARLRENLGDYADALIQVFKDADKANPNLTFYMFELSDN